MSGWFIYYLKPRGEAEVVQLATMEDGRARVLDHLIYHAWKSGAVAISGRLDPLFAPCMIQRRFSLTLAEPWSQIHSSRPELVEVFRQGDVFFNRLDAEWWLGF